jgi:SAM-dependent methyltransferase
MIKIDAGDTSAYDTLAPEYYDAKHHPTCANFRHASKQIIKPWLEKLADYRPICEVGAGMSVTAELLLEAGESIADLFLTDSAQSMLEYSLGWKIARDHISVAEASKLPFPASSFSLCISSLGDPYNTEKMWAELARVLRNDGYAIFTTPSYEWASIYRGLTGSGDRAAEFCLSDGRTIFAPSMIYDQNYQTKLIGSEPLMEVVDFRVITYSQLPARSISPKLLVARENNLPIVVGYLVRKSLL